MKLEEFRQSKRDRAEQRAHEFIQWVELNERFPTSKTSDPVEKQHAVWIVAMRAAKRKTTGYGKRMSLYPNVEELLNENLPDWLETNLPLGNREEYLLRRAREFIEFYSKNNSFPATTKGTPIEERLLGAWLSRMRRNLKNGKLKESVKNLLSSEIPNWTSAPKKVWKII